MARHWGVPDIMLVIGAAPAIAAVFSLLLRWYAGHDTVAVTVAAH